MWDDSFSLMQPNFNDSQMFIFNPFSPGGRRHIQLPWETFFNNSVTPQDIKMKFFKFNPTPMGAILHMVTILINLMCYQWQPFVMNVLRNKKVKKLAYLAGYWFDLAQIWCREYFWILNLKSATKFLYNIIPMSK